jgi:hypothetical protein
MKKRQKQLDDVDVLFDPRLSTESEKKLISNYIRKDKANRGQKHRAGKAGRNMLLLLKPHS